MKQQEKLVIILHEVIIDFKCRSYNKYFFFQQKEKIMKIASTTHKQRVEEFNRHLDSLTEHFDIPKVSWTK